MRVGIPIDDLTAGNLLALGIMMALFDRERTGVGRWVTTSLLEAQIFMLDFQASALADGRRSRGRPATTTRPAFPPACSRPATATSTSPPVPAACSRASARRSASRSGWTSRSGRPRTARSEDRKAINAAIGEITETKPSDHWIELFEGDGIPCGPIYSIDQVFADPQVKHLRHGDADAQSR